MFYEGWAVNGEESLTRRVSGEGSDYVCHHLGGLVVPSSIIPKKRGVCYVIKDLYRWHEGVV